MLIYGKATCGSIQKKFRGGKLGNWWPRVSMRLPFGIPFGNVWDLLHVHVLPILKNKHKAKRKPSQTDKILVVYGAGTNSPPAHLLQCAWPKLLCLTGLLYPHLGSLLTPNTNHRPPLSWKPVSDSLLWLPSLVLSLGRNAKHVLWLCGAQLAEARRRLARPARSLDNRPLLAAAAA